MIQIIQFILALTILVFLHELGHFTFAKLFKTRVTRFYIFANWKFHLFSTYDNWWRKLWKKPLITEREGGSKKYNDEAGTEYGIGWLPIGGYCAIDGMVDETQSAEELAKKPVQPWEFRAKKKWQKLLIMAGGVMVNFILAFVIYSACLFTWGEDYYAVKDLSNGMYFNDEAKELGFRNGDIMLGTELGEFKDFGADLYRDLAVAKECYVMRDGKKVTVNLPGDMDLLNMMKAAPRFVSPLTPMLVDSVMPASPAAKANLRKGDTILSLNGTDISSYNEFSDNIGRLLDELTGAETSVDSMRIRTVDMVIAHNDTKTTDSVKVLLDVDVTKNLFGKKTTRLTMGFYNAFYAKNDKLTHIDFSLLESIPAGIEFGWSVLAGYVGDMKYLFSAEGAKSLGGFGTIGSLFPEIWNWHVFWLMTAFLSIILAFMNILPIPGLDGGHIMFLIYEMITGKEPGMKFQSYAQNIGFGLLIALMVLANLNDILRGLGLM